MKWVPFEGDQQVHAGTEKAEETAQLLDERTHQALLSGTLGPLAAPVHVVPGPICHVHLSGFLAAHPRLPAPLQRAEALTMPSAALLPRDGSQARISGGAGGRAARGCPGCVRVGVCICLDTSAAHNIGRIRCLPARRFFGRSIPSETSPKRGVRQAPGARRQAWSQAPHPQQESALRARARTPNAAASIWAMLPQPPDAWSRPVAGTSRDRPVPRQLWCSASIREEQQLSGTHGCDRFGVATATPRRTCF